VRQLGLNQRRSRKKKSGMEKKGGAAELPVKDLPPKLRGGLSATLIGGTGGPFGGRFGEGGELLEVQTVFDERSKSCLRRLQ